MTSTIQIFGSLIGGLGLFILAVGMMTDGLKQAAGSTLRNILANCTDTPFRGLIFGFFITALMQSSSAVMVTTIGFINAGLLSIRQALGIIYGANIGTTITAWLVVLVGFKMNIPAFALPMIGVGMLVRIFKKDGKLPALGLALVGLGLFFLGIDIIKNAFESVVSAFDISTVAASGSKDLVVFMLIGIAMTILMQSSSAATVLTITAAASGVLDIAAAAAMIIGAHIGTTSTAVLAAIGATANTKRIALAQVMLNVGTSGVALLLLPVLFVVINTLKQALGLSAEVSVTLALFNTMFNLVGLLIFFPLNERLARFIERRFIPKDQISIQPKHLDQTIAATPVLAVNALSLELQDLVDEMKVLVCTSFVSTTIMDKELQLKLNRVHHLANEVSKFIVVIQKNELTEETINYLSMLLRVDEYLLSCANNIELVVKKYQQLQLSTIPEISSLMHDYERSMAEIISMEVDGNFTQNMGLLQTEHDQLKAKLLAESTMGRLEFAVLIEVLDLLAIQLRLSLQWLKACKYLQDIKKELPQTCSPVISGPLAI